MLCYLSSQSQILLILQTHWANRWLVHLASGYSNVITSHFPLTEFLIPIFFVTYLNLQNVYLLYHWFTRLINVWKDSHFLSWRWKQFLDFTSKTLSSAWENLSCVMFILYNETSLLSWVVPIRYFPVFNIKLFFSLLHWKLFIYVFLVDWLK